jgi:UDP-N-acetylmuramoyl-L-alanine---L-glutamate ligase
MTIQELNHRNVCILGYGQEGRATFQALQQYAPSARITIADGNPDTVPPEGANLITGPDYLDELDAFDAIIKSPGIPWRPGGHLANKLTSATALFLDSLPQGPGQVIGVTGTKGKSTTSHLIYQVLKAAGKSVYLAGNIGDPMLGYLDRATPDTLFVLELSSYQLETLRISPHIAVVTSFFPDHLDYHEGLANYLEAKENIAKYQRPDDIIFYNPAYPECGQIADLSPGHKQPFTPEDLPAPLQPLSASTKTTDSLHLATTASNLAAVYQVARYCEIPEATIIETLMHAENLPHRQQSLGTHHGIEWIDDSAATTPQSTLAALDALGNRIDTIIVGGLDRGYDFSELGARLAASPLSNIVLFPDTGAAIRTAIEAHQPSSAKTYFETSKMSDAVAFARQHTQSGRVCILSSGSPSYNLFKNYPDRGRAFQEAVTKTSTEVPTETNPKADTETQATR